MLYTESGMVYYTKTDMVYTLRHGMHKVKIPCTESCMICTRSGRVYAGSGKVDTESGML